MHKSNAEELTGVPLTRPQKGHRRLHAGSFDHWHTNVVPMQEEEGWFLTYLDVMTLLLVMMVVVLTFTGPVGRTNTPVSPHTSPSAQGQTKASAESLTEPAAESKPKQDTLAGLPLDQLGSHIQVLVNERTISFRISSEILFASGEAGLTQAGQMVLSRLLPVFRYAAQHRIVVEGHTDNVPIQTARFPSNWELAAGRAGSVVRYLDSQGVAPERMRAIGYADTRPISPNDTPAGRASNRRVEIVLESK
jgi:chemotaxis protein MotB